MYRNFTSGEGQREGREERRGSEKEAFIRELQTDLGRFQINEQ
jgi:hypothetical protein